MADCKTLLLQFICVLTFIKTASNCKICSTNTYISGYDQVLPTLNALHPVTAECSEASDVTCTDGQECIFLTRTFQLTWENGAVEGVGKVFESQCKIPDAITCELWQEVYPLEPVAGSGLQAVIIECQKGNGTFIEEKEEEKEDEKEEELTTVNCTHCSELVVTNDNVVEQVVPEFRFYYEGVGTGAPDVPSCQAPTTIQCTGEQPICQTYTLTYMLDSETGSKFKSETKGCGGSSLTCEELKTALTDYYSPDEIPRISDCWLRETANETYETEMEEEVRGEKDSGALSSYLQFLPIALSILMNFNNRG